MRYITFMILTGTVIATTVPAPAADLSPRYGVRVEVNVRVPMRDGTKLATDLYFPDGVTGKVPAILGNQCRVMRIPNLGELELILG